MSHKFKGWSYSALTSFEQCPKRYYHTRVVKDIPDPPGEAAMWGQRVHKDLELHVKGEKELPEELDYLRPMVDKIVGAPYDEIHAERQYCLNEEFELTEWFGKDAWCRSVIDLEIRRRRKGLLLDWKSGKRKPDNDQLQLFAAVVLTADTQLDEVSTGFLWLKDKKIDREKYNRDDVPGIWQSFVPRVDRMVSAFEVDKWPAKPSGLCKSYCPVGKSRCVHCGRD